MHSTCTIHLHILIVNHTPPPFTKIQAVIPIHNSAEPLDPPARRISRPRRHIGAAEANDPQGRPLGRLLAASRLARERSRRLSATRRGP